VNDRTLFQVTRIGSQKLRGEIVRALYHQVVLRDELPRVVGQKALLHQLEVRARMLRDGSERTPCGVELVRANVCPLEEDLTMQIALIDAVVVTQGQRPDAGLHQGERHRATEPAEPNQ